MKYAFIALILTAVSAQAAGPDVKMLVRKGRSLSMVTP